MSPKSSPIVHLLAWLVASQVATYCMCTTTTTTTTTTTSTSTTTTSTPPPLPAAPSKQQLNNVNITSNVQQKQQTNELRLSRSRGGRLVGRRQLQAHHHAGRYRLPTWFNYNLYKRLYNKRYGPGAANERHRRIYLRTALLVFEQRAKFRAGRLDSLASMNELSDLTNDELDAFRASKRRPSELEARQAALDRPLEQQTSGRESNDSSGHLFARHPLPPDCCSYDQVYDQIIELLNETTSNGPDLALARALVDELQQKPFNLKKAKSDGQAELEQEGRPASRVEQDAHHQDIEDYYDDDDDDDDVDIDIDDQPPRRGGAKRQPLDVRLSDSGAGGRGRPAASGRQETRQGSLPDGSKPKQGHNETAGGWGNPNGRQVAWRAVSGADKAPEPTTLLDSGRLTSMSALASNDNDRRRQWQHYQHADDNNKTLAVIESGVRVAASGAATGASTSTSTSMSGAQKQSAAAGRRQSETADVDVLEGAHRHNGRFATIRRRDEVVAAAATTTPRPTAASGLAKSNLLAEPDRRAPTTWTGGASTPQTPPAEATDEQLGVPAELAESIRRQVEEQLGERSALGRQLSASFSALFGEPVVVRASAVGPARPVELGPQTNKTKTITANKNKTTSKWSPSPPPPPPSSSSSSSSLSGRHLT